MSEPKDMLKQLQHDKEETQAFIRKAMDDLRSKYPDAKFKLIENIYNDSAYGHPVTFFHKIEITATL